MIDPSLIPVAITFFSQPLVISCSIMELTGLAVLVGLVTFYKSRNCGVKWCPMVHHHAVTGTVKSVCHIHHTKKHHEQLQSEHPDGRLAHGESVQLATSGQSNDQDHPRFINGG